MAAFASFSESDWQTTRVSPGARRSSAEASERAFGTAPPAHGVTVQSGAGSGQYPERSTCADAPAGSASSVTATTTLTMRRPPTRAGVSTGRRRSSKGKRVQRDLDRNAAPLVAVRDGMSRVLRPADAHADRGARPGEVAPPQLALGPAHADRDDVAVAPVADRERVRAAAAPAGDRDQCQLPTGERVQR